MKNTELIAAQERIANIEADIASLSKAKIPLDERVRELRLASSYNSNAGDNSIQRRVAALLGEAALPPRDSNSEELRKALHELAAHNKAFDTLRSRLLNEKRKLASLLSAELQPEHTKFVRRFFEALQHLHGVHLEYEHFINNADNIGADLFALKVVRPTQLGSARDGYGVYAFAFKEFVEAGHVSKSALPKDLQ